MNSTTSAAGSGADFKKSPMIQETLFSTTVKNKRDRLHKIIDNMTDAEVQNGNIIYPSYMPSFTQTGMSTSVACDIQDGTNTKPHTRRIMRYTIPGRLNCYDGQQL